MMSSRLAPASRFSKMAETGMRVPFNTQAPLTLPGTLSTAEHCDQSRSAIQLDLFLRITSRGQKEKANLISQTGLHLCRQRPTLPQTFACGTIARAGLASACGYEWSDPLNRKPACDF